MKPSKVETDAGGWSEEPERKVGAVSAAKYTIFNMPTSPNLKSGAQIYVNFCFDPRTLAVSAAADINEMGDLEQAIETHLNLGLGKKICYFN